MLNIPQDQFSGAKTKKCKKMRVDMDKASLCLVPFSICHHTSRSLRRQVGPWWGREETNPGPACSSAWKMKDGVEVADLWP